MTTTLAPSATADTTTGDDNEPVAHLVPKDQLADALVFGTPIVALCGKRWVPSRDPEGKPKCGPCHEALDRIRGGETL